MTKLNLLGATALAVMLFSSPALAATVLKVDASKAAPLPETGYLKMGNGLAPDGQTIEINNRYLLLNGAPWLPIMGEFHPTRYPEQYWEDEIVKMKSAGIDIVAYYIIWSHHEAEPGQFNFSGDRDIRRFTELCAKHGLKVVVRIGPWAHAEVRYGGTPYWVTDQMPSRRNDATYMGYVSRYWTELAKQLKGEMWKDGGPIIGVQLENEYNQTGPGAGIEHITALKKLAVSLGFDVPLYTVTGWDGTVYPKGEVAPVFGGYLDEPWGMGATKMAPNEVYNFRFTTRVAGDAGAQTPATTKGTAVEDMDHTPFLGAEYGPGLPEMYRRRPLVATDDVGALWPVQLGSGVNLYGYYMFHGGRNPGLNMEENALVGGYNDVPIISYDFQAPYGQYGQAHPVLNTIRPFHMFLKSFGNRLAPMTVYAPDVQPKTRADQTTPRYSVRAADGSGFVFFNNYLRQYPLAEQKDVQFDVNLGNGKTVKFPSAPVTVKTGAYFIWPVNFDLDGINLAWASAQPVTRIETGKNAATYFFAAEDDIAPELAITTPAGTKISGAGQSKQGGLTLIHPKPSNGVAATVTANGKTITIVVVSKAESRRLWQGEVAGKTRLVLSDDEVSFDKGSMELRSMGDANFKIGVYPALDKTPSGSLNIGLAKTTGIFQTFVARAQPKELTATLTELRPAGKAPAPNIGGRAGKVMQPFPEAIGRTSAAWSIAVPKGALDGVADVFLDIDYQGDIGRLFAGADMIDDDYYFGPVWQIGLKRFKDRLNDPLTVTVMPLRKDSPIYIDDSVRAALPAGDQVAVVKSVKLVPQYALKLTF